MTISVGLASARKNATAKFVKAPGSSPSALVSGLGQWLICAFLAPELAWNPRTPFPQVNCSRSRFEFWSPCGINMGLCASSQINPRREQRPASPGLASRFGSYILSRVASQSKIDLHFHSFQAGVRGTSHPRGVCLSCICPASRCHANANLPCASKPSGQRPCLRWSSV